VRRERGGATEQFSDRLWSASIVRRDDPEKVDFSKKAAVRGAKWFVLVAHLYWFLRANREGNVTRKILEAVERPDALSGLVLGEELQRAIVGVRGPGGTGYNDYPMAFHSGFLNNERDQDVAVAASKQRLRSLFRVFGQGGE
jgi:hypothetical protein